MATTKVTFTFDQATVARLDDGAKRLAVPKSEFVREAIREHHERIGLLNEGERARLLKIVERLAHRGPTRSQREVTTELAGLRAARRAGGRLHPN